MPYGDTAQSPLVLAPSHYLIQCASRFTTLLGGHVTVMLIQSCTVHSLHRASEAGFNVFKNIHMPTFENFMFLKPDYIEN